MDTWEALKSLGVVATIFAAMIAAGSAYIIQRMMSKQKFSQELTLHRVKNIETFIEAYLSSAKESNDPQEKKDKSALLDLFKRKYEDLLALVNAVSFIDPYVVHERASLDLLIRDSEDIKSKVEKWVTKIMDGALDKDNEKQKEAEKAHKELLSESYFLHKDFSLRLNNILKSELRQAFEHKA